MISAELAGGDCLNSGCVPSKALLKCSKLIREAKKAATKNNEFGISFRHKSSSSSSLDHINERRVVLDLPMEDVEVAVNFPQIMQRMRNLRSKIAPVDGHDRGNALGTQTFQGRGVFTSPTTIEVVEEGKVLGDSTNPQLKFRKAVIATGGRPNVPEDIKGLKDAPYTTNLNLFNLQQLPKRMVVLGAGIVALEMAQAFATFGSEVIVLQRSRLLSKGDEDAARVIQSALEKDGVQFLSGVNVKEVQTLHTPSSDEDLPLMNVILTCNEYKKKEINLECECLLLALGRSANVQNMGLDNVNVQYHPTNGVLVNDYSQSISNPNVYAVGDCVAYVPRLTHMSGEMAKVVVQNSLFNGQWKLSSFVVPAVMYTEPEYAVTSKVICLDENGHVVKEVTLKHKDTDEESLLDVYKAELKSNDRAILDSSDQDGYVKIYCKKGTGTIVKCTIVSSRAGEMINEVSLAIKHGIDLEGVGRNIHSYPTLGEAVMGCGLQYINSRWATM